jgi:hypothetical protein
MEYVHFVNKPNLPFGIICESFSHSLCLQMSAAAFAKGLLDLEGQLTPILVCVFPLKKRIDPFFW